MQDDNKSGQGLADLYEVRISRLCFNTGNCIGLQFLLDVHDTFCYFYVIFLRCFYFIWQQEYVQKTDPTSAPLSFKDELKNEVRHLTALLHFYFYYYLISLSSGCVSFLMHLQYWSGCVAYPFRNFFIPWILCLFGIRQARCLRKSVWSWMPFLISTLLQNL